MADLAARQFELEGLVFGEGTPILVAEFLPGGKPEVEVQDQRRPRADGVLFGRDFLGGQLLVFELSVDTNSEATARVQWNQLSEAWDAARDEPGVTVPLRINAGAGTRRAYGRPRKLEPATLQLLRAGRIDLVADFQARDHLFYDDAETSARLDQVAPTSTGLVAPLVEPLSTEPFGSRDGFVTNDGAAETPVTVTFHGPSTSPSLTLVGPNEVLKLDMTIASGETVVVDTWARTVLRDGTANVAGKLTRNSRFWHLPSGTSELRYQAIDATATSFATVTWRDAHYSL